MTAPADEHTRAEATGDLAAFVHRWNQEQDLSTPRHHRRMIAWLAAEWQAGHRRLLLMAFRNAGKSTLVGLFAAWLLYDDPARRIIVLSADHNLARRMVRAVKRIIERHPWAKGLKPERADEWASDRFTVARESELRDPSMIARGIGANITGSRADIVICDDVEVPNTCDTPGKREALRARLDEIEFVLVPGGAQLFVGTPHTSESIYSDHPATDGSDPWLHGFGRFELPLLDSRGVSAWPERFQAADIEALRLRSGPAKFQSQMMLSPLSLADSRLDTDGLIPYDAELDYRQAGGEAALRLGTKRLLSVSCWWDPAYGKPGQGDASVIACVFTDEDGHYRLHGIEYITHDPAKTGDVSEAGQQCRAVARFASRFHVPCVTIETNGIGRFLPGLLRNEIRRAGLHVAVRERNTSRAKDLRIINAFDAPLAGGTLFAHDAVMKSPLIGEMRDWRPGSGKRDDGLDAVAGCLLNEPVRLPLNADTAMSGRPADWRRGSQQHQAACAFTP